MKRKSEISVFQIVVVFVGTIIGAGFASGQEIYQFFGRFQGNGLLGLAVAGLLFMVLTYKIMSLGYRLKIVSYSDIIKSMEFVPGIKLLDGIIAFFLFGTFVVMLSGTGALLSEQWNLPFLYGNIIMALLTTLTILRGLDGIVKANAVIVPFLMVGIFVLCIISGLDAQILHEGNGLKRIIPKLLDLGWLLSSIIYVAYNILLATPILLVLGEKASSDKTLRKASFFGGLLIILIASGIYGVILLHGDAIAERGIEVPMAYIASRIGFGFKIMYVILLLLGIYTTAVSSFYGFAQQFGLMDGVLNSKSILLIMGGVAILFSMIGFSNLIKYLYTLEGYVGILFLYILLTFKG